MLALAAADVAGAVVFALLYAAGAARWLTQPAFLAALVVFFVAVSACWVRVERNRGAGRGALGRIGRAAGGLALTVVGLPGLVLVPLFALQQNVPPEAGVEHVIRPAMVLLLISLALVGLVNVVGLAYAGLVGLGRRGARAR